MTTALKEAPQLVTYDASDLTPLPDARIRWDLHVRLINEDQSLTPAEKQWYSDPAVLTAADIADMLEIWRGEGDSRVPNGDRIHELRRRNETRPMPHPQTWLDYDFMGVGRRNQPGWFAGRARYFVQLRGSHVYDPRLHQLIPGMLTLNVVTDAFEVIKGAPRHGRPRKFRPSLSQRPRTEAT